MKQRARAADVVFQQQIEFRLEIRIVMNREVRSRQLVKRSDEGLGHKTSPVLPPISMFVGLIIHNVSFTARMKSSTFAESFLPGSDSRLLQASTAYGRTVLTALPTFSVER